MKPFVSSVTSRRALFSMVFSQEFINLLRIVLPDMLDQVERFAILGQMWYVHVISEWLLDNSTKITTTAVYLIVCQKYYAMTFTNL